MDEVSDEDEDEEDEDEDDDFDEDDDEDEKPRRSRAKPRGKATNGRARGGKTTPGAAPIRLASGFRARRFARPCCLACGVHAQIRLWIDVSGPHLANTEADT